MKSPLKMYDRCRAICCTFFCVIPCLCNIRQIVLELTVFLMMLKSLVLISIRYSVGCAKMRPIRTNSSLGDKTRVAVLFGLKLSTAPVFVYSLHILYTVPTDIQRFVEIFLMGTHSVALPYYPVSAQAFFRSLSQDIFDTTTRIT